MHYNFRQLNRNHIYFQLPNTALEQAHEAFSAHFL
jgi:hypothetical protein